MRETTTQSEITGEDHTGGHQGGTRTMGVVEAAAEVEVVAVAAEAEAVVAVVINS